MICSAWGCRVVIVHATAKMQETRKVFSIVRPQRAPTLSGVHRGIIDGNL